jgi:hypothetical protein
MPIRINTGGKMKKISNESIVLDATRDYFTMKGWFVIRHHQGLGSNNGMSDLTAIKNGRTIYIETKAPGWRKKLSKVQLKFKTNIERHGGIFLVIDNIDEMMRIVNELG